MLLMFMETRKKHIENVVSEIFNSKLYEHPHIDFILIKEVNGKSYYTAGVSDKLDSSKVYLFRPKAKAKSIPIQNVRYENPKYRELFDECIEGYVLHQIQKGYEIAFMSIAFHIAVWEFVDAHNLNIEWFGDGVTKYFQFCFDTGISSTLLSNYTCEQLPDHIRNFLDIISYEVLNELVEKLLLDNLEIMKSLTINNDMYHEILTRGTRYDKSS